MKTLNFIKEKSGGWYIDLPEWTGSKADLAMVAGADKLLDVLANKSNKVSMTVALAPVDGYHHLKLKNLTPNEGGGMYTPSGDKKYPEEIWLCDVTKFVFGGYMPADIYFQKITKKDPYGIQRSYQIASAK
jgi:hypothetical protein